MEIHDLSLVIFAMRRSFGPQILTNILVLIVMEFRRRGEDTRKKSRSVFKRIARFKRRAHEYRGEKEAAKKEEENQDKTDERARGSNAPWKLVDKEREWYHLYGRPFPNATLGTWGCPTSLTCVSFFKHFRTGQKILRLRYKQTTLLTIWLNDRSISPRIIWCHSSRWNSCVIQFLINVSHLHYQYDFFAIVVGIICEIACSAIGASNFAISAMLIHPAEKYHPGRRETALLL